LNYNGSRVEIGGRNSRGDIYILFRKRKLIGSRMGVGEINLCPDAARLNRRKKSM
jgi:hypothetical protein